MKVQWILAAAFALTSGLAVAAGAQTLDQDGDGTISKQEAQADPKLAENFDSLDQNGDEVLDSAEFAQFEADSMQEETKE